MSTEADLKKALSTSAGAATCAAVWAAKAAATKSPEEALQWSLASINASATAAALVKQGK